MSGKLCPHCHRPMPEFGEIIANENSGIVLLGLLSVKLTRQEFALFRYLLDRRGNYCSRSSLGYQLSPDQLDTQGNIIRIHICRMRKKLARIGLEINHAERGPGGRGWRLNEPGPADPSAVRTLLPMGTPYDA